MHDFQGLIARDNAPFRERVCGEELFWGISRIFRTCTSIQNNAAQDDNACAAQ